MDHILTSPPPPPPSRPSITIASTSTSTSSSSSNTTAPPRRSFLGKLPIILPKKLPLLLPKPPHPRRFIPFRSGAFHRAKSSKPLDPSAKVLAHLVIRVLEGRNLVAKDKNGLSDPFCVIRYGGKRVQSSTIKKSLNPIWARDVDTTSVEVGVGVGVGITGGEAKLQVEVFEESNWREHVEVVVWDSDRVGKQYLGEISLGLEDWFSSSRDRWNDGIPPIDFFDANNKPSWYPIQSSRTKSTVSGDLLVQIGFVDPITSKSLSPTTLEALLKLLNTLSEEESSNRRTSKEEMVFIASPTESVGTTLIGDNLPLSTSPPRGPHLPLGAEGEEEESDDSDSDSDDENKSISSGGASTDDEGEGEEEDGGVESEALFSPEEITTPSIDYFSVTRDPPTPPTPPTTTNETVDTSTNLSSTLPIPITLTPPPISPTFTSSPSTVPVSIPPATSPPITLLPPALPRTSSGNSIRRGLNALMKRKGPSVTNLKNSGDVQTESEGNGTNSDLNSGSGSNAKEVEKVKERRRRFSRKKTIKTTVVGGEEGEEEIGGDKKSRRKKLSKHKKGKGKEGEEIEEEKDGKKLRNRKTRLGKTKKDYQYEDDDDIFGLVQIEIRGAKDLPKFKNMLKTGWDMDPFVIISFGQKVFRTRVVRHQLNPVWDEKLFFHVRRTEVGWAINFNIYDWDKMSSNDYVGEISVPLDELLGSTIQSDERGLYPTTAEGKLVGDDFKEHDLVLGIQDPDLGKPTLHIRAKFTPYDALRQQFWRTYLRQYDIDESGAFSHLEIFSMLDSLGSTLSKATISSFFSRFGKTTDMELTADEIVICLEQELRRPMEDKRPVDESSLDSGVATPNLGMNTEPLTFTTVPTANEELVEGEGLAFAPKTTLPVTDLSNNMETIELGEEVITNKELGTVVKALPINESELTTSGSIPTEQSSAQLSDDEEVGPEGVVERVINIRECPLCRKPRLNNKMEVDIVTHLGICASTDPRGVNRLVVGNYVTASQAQRKWFTKVISKATKGAYILGANSANIIVQDRQTGMLQEEKISTYIRLGIRLAYKGIGAGGGMEGTRIRKMLESMSIKQGVRFNSPTSVREIEPFIAFHNLPMSEVLEPMSSFKTFNEFFYRKLKPEARPVSDPDDPKTLVSPADCRAMFFESISDATTFWIKGREFSIQRLLGGEEFKEKAKIYEGGSLAIFRLAPQDYHRYHSPVDGIMGPLHRISGKYFTVNPMAIRSAIDIYGENIRVVAPIYSPTFGEVMNIWIGAMLVGSIEFTKQPGEEVKRGEETGYFAFGGSTIICLFAPGMVKFDEDLLVNSRASLETLVRMGSRIGRKID